MDWPELSEDVRRRRLEAPEGVARAVLDTDTYNEIDDQFALVQALLSPEQVSLEAVYAAPFHNKRSSGPADGMEKSYEEIMRLLDRVQRSPDGFVFRGSTSFLPDAQTPVESEAVTDLIQRADSDTEPLYVVAIGAITNVASALLLEPSLVARTVVVWLGGHSRHWPHTREFNLKQDTAAAQIVFDSGVPLIRVPCMGVTTHLRTTVPELEQYVQGRGAIGDYLVDIFKAYSNDHFAWSKEIWDMAAVAFLIDSDWLPSELVPSPVLSEDVTWGDASGRHQIRDVYYVDRDPIFRDFFRKLSAFVGEE